MQGTWHGGTGGGRPPGDVTFSADEYITNVTVHQENNGNLGGLTIRTNKQEFPRYGYQGNVDLPASPADDSMQLLYVEGNTGNATCCLYKIVFHFGHS